MASRILLFDIDGTLLKTGGAGQTAMERALQREFRIDRPFEGVTTAGRTDRGIESELFGRYGIEDSPEQRRRYRSAYLRELPGSLQDSPGLLLPGVTSLLERLADISDIAIGLLTGNYEDAAWIKLRHYRLNHFFAFGGFGDNHPDRDDVAQLAYRAAESGIGRAPDPASVWVIGDTPADVRCARSIGANVLAVATGVYDHGSLAETDADHVLHDLSDTDNFLSLTLGGTTA